MVGGTCVAVALIGRTERVVIFLLVPDLVSIKVITQIMIATISFNKMNIFTELYWGRLH